MASSVARLEELSAQGRLPISRSNVQQVPLDAGTSFDRQVAERSGEADLVIKAPLGGCRRSWPAAPPVDPGAEAERIVR
ncbi:MAG: hypothetical protein FJ125_04640 [Deltaproteobacteria bacterium]|nr:hypothetical protein [Deltaproteobacteria bacterium]